MFLDENVQELLRRRASLVEDDNPDSPSISNNQNFSQQPQNAQQQSQSNQYGQQQQQTGGPGSQSQSHIFLPPTSPAVMPARSSGTTGGVPAPSPVHHNYFAQSPGITSAPASNAPSIAQSPGGAGGGGPGGSGGSGANTSSGALFTNFGSPAIPHSSPANPSQSQILPPNQSQQPPSHPSSHQQHMIQSPSGFMSPATSNQQQNYATQSPANFSGNLIL